MLTLLYTVKSFIWASSLYLDVLYLNCTLCVFCLHFYCFFLRGAKRFSPHRSFRCRLRFQRPSLPNVDVSIEGVDPSASNGESILMPQIKEMSRLACCLSLSFLTNLSFLGLEPRTFGVTRLSCTPFSTLREHSVGWEVKDCAQQRLPCNRTAVCAHSGHRCQHTRPPPPPLWPTIETLAPASQQRAHLALSTQLTTRCMINVSCSHAATDTI